MAAGSSKKKKKKDFFDVLFAGLFLFKKKDHVAVMPDGREPDDDRIPPHVPFLVVKPDAVKAGETTGWEGNDAADTEDGIYRLDNCTIEITKATTPGDLDASQHDTNIVNLRDVDGTYQFAGNEAQIITQITIGQGTLELFRRPNAQGQSSDTVTVSRLRVPHDGDIFVTVKFNDENEPRILALQPGTDVAIANAILDFDPAKTGNAFGLFGRVTKGGQINVPQEFQMPGVPALPNPMQYQIFQLGIPIGEGSGSGGGGGCCPPP